MAGLFSLGGGGGGGGRGGGSNQEDEPGHHHHNPPTGVPHPDAAYFWYKNNEDVSCYRGFELWNQQPVMPPQARPLLPQDLYSLGVGPSSRSSDDQSSSRSGAMMMMRSGGGSSGSGGISCQDCGNQAKKDCPHMRCRTCCKSRGYDCQTHLKSTWVPASKRRERQQQQQQPLQLRGGAADNNPKRLRDITCNNNPSTSTAHVQMATTHSSSAEGLEHGSFPALVSSSAEFRCVRVSSMDEADEQYAYQTAVNIGGHVFRGILYDQGPDPNYMSTADTSPGGAVQPLNLIAATGASALPAAAAASGGGAVAAGASSSTGPLLDPSLYAAPLNPFMSGSGTQFFPHPRS
ncbi:hypothetical protein K1719_019281 [Acacia pycnantha]|nr:hypothetical protein K1719_019281 [Acacia pycnantha]